MAYLRRFEDTIFYATLFTVSLQIGKHFWPSYAFVSGVRIDYLSPTLYASDLGIFMLLVFVVVFRPADLFRACSSSVFVPVFFILLLVSSLVAPVSEAAWVGSLKIVEMVFFAWYVMTFRFTSQKFLRVIDIWVVAACVQAMIALGQFALQRSVGGALYFLGERTFSVATIGIASFVVNGTEFLRPYGTFPHPNVLATFLATTLLLASAVVLAKGERRSYLYLIPLFLVSIALLLTFSRVIILLVFLAIPLVLVRSRIVLIFTSAVVAAFVVTSGRFSLESLYLAISSRLMMYGVALQMIVEHIAIGTGINNYFFFTDKHNTLPLFLRFQPVHSIYLLILVQLGTVGGFIAGIVLVRIFRHARGLIRGNHSPHRVVAGIVIAYLIIGIGDHFFLTLQQGMLLMAAMVGLLFNRHLMERE